MAIGKSHGQAIAIFHMVVYSVLLVLNSIVFYFRYRFETVFFRGRSFYTWRIFADNLKYLLEIVMAIRLFNSFRKGKRFLYRSWRNFRLWVCALMIIFGTATLVLHWINYYETDFENVYFYHLERDFYIVTAKVIVLSVCITDLVLSIPLAILFVILLNKYDKKVQQEEIENDQNNNVNPSDNQGQPQQGIAWNATDLGAFGGGNMANGYPGYAPLGNYYPLPGSVPPRYSQQGYIPARGANYYNNCV